MESQLAKFTFLYFSRTDKNCNERIIDMGKFIELGRLPVDF